MVRLAATSPPEPGAPPDAGADVAALRDVVARQRSETTRLKEQQRQAQLALEQALDRAAKAEQTLEAQRIEHALLANRLRWAEARLAAAGPARPAPRGEPAGGVPTPLDPLQLPGDATPAAAGHELARAREEERGRLLALSGQLQNDLLLAAVEHEQLQQQLAAAQTEHARVLCMLDDYSHELHATKAEAQAAKHSVARLAAEIAALKTLSSKQKRETQRLKDQLQELMSALELARQQPAAGEGPCHASPAA